jgi:recombinational DNA repair protein RecT
MSNVNNSPKNIIEVIQSTPANKVAELDFVRDKYIQNFNACHKEKVGELMYHRNVIHFKQTIAGSDPLQKCDPFSLYACFATAAVNGYSLDPGDNEVYLIARKGKACLDRQAGAYIRRLLRTNQIQFAEQAKIVYQGDIFQVVNGRVLQHVESFQSDIIVAGYIRFVVDENGADRFFIYRKSDFESWRKKSANPATIMKQSQNGNQYLSESLWDNGILGGTQPEPNFLRTKIVKHAAKEKCWATGNTPAVVEVFAEVEVDSDDDGQKLTTTTQLMAPVQSQPQQIAQAQVTPAPVMTVVSDDSFVQETKPAASAGKSFEDDNF